VGRAAVGRTRLTFRRLAGLDRSGPAPAQTQAGAPLRPWTIPNAIGYARFALLPVFLAIAFSSGDGTSAAAAVVYAVIGWSDYADGIAARLTGQYSRLGALMDPLIDRLLVISGFTVCFAFDLLPRWAILVLAGREAFMLVLTPLALRRGVELRINWPGRIGVWPAMSAPFWAMVEVRFLALLCLYWGIAFVWWATALYVRDALRGRRPSSSS
jgi:cardiolipin synthase